MEWIILIIYILALFSLAYMHRKAETLDEYLVAGKNRGTWVTALSARTTGESGWLILGVTGMGYAVGLQGIWIVLGETFFVTISWYFMARKFKQFADNCKAVTVVDYFEHHIGSKIGIVRVTSTLIIFILVTVYLAAQFAAVGKAFHVFLGLNMGIGILIGAVIVCLYTMIGGFKTVSITDLFQGILMIIGLILIIIFGLLSLKQSGFDVDRDLSGLWNVWGTSGFSAKSLIQAISYFAIGLGFLGVPHVYVRFIAAKDINTIKKGIPIAILFTFIGDGAALFVGIIGRYIVPNIADSEFVFPVLSQTLFGPIMVGLLIAVVLSAIMSTADSLLMLISGSIVRDVYQKLLNQEVRDKNLIMHAKIIILIISIFSLVISFNDNRLVFWMVLFAWSALASAFNPVMILSLTNFKIYKYGAVAGIIGGSLTSIL